MMIFFYIYFMFLCDASPNISVPNGSDTTLTCKLNGTFTLPEWAGPPDFTIYNHQGSKQFNPFLPFAFVTRLGWTNDNISLVIRSVKQSDSGQYRCFYINLTYYIVELVVTEPENTGRTEKITGPADTVGSEKKRKHVLSVTGGQIASIVALVACSAFLMYCFYIKRRRLGLKCCELQYDYLIQGKCAEECNNFKMLQNDLIIYYRMKLSKLQVSPLFEEEGYAGNFFDFYVKPNISILSQPMSNGRSESTPVTFHDIFTSKPCQNIYILSSAGCGKTSLTKYLALIWCQAHLPVESDNRWFLKEGNISIKEDVKEMRKFKFLFTIILRDVYEQECDVERMIQNHLLPNLANKATYTELGDNFLQNLLKSKKCIIILDGLDEWRHPPGNMCKLKNIHIPHSLARPQCTTLTTSRPWKLDVVKLKPEDIDLKLELNELGDDLLKHLIHKAVYKLNELHGKEMQAENFEQKLRSKKIKDMSKIPVVLMQLLTLWFDNEPIGESQCDIYSNMIEFLFKRYCKEKEIVSEMEEIEVDCCSRDKSIPMCLKRHMYSKDHVELLAKLATLAYNTLFTHTEESSLVFDRKITNKYLNDQEIEISLAVGILKQEKVIGKMSKRQSHISFIHKTFQEYLTALYVVLKPGTMTHVEEKIKRVCCSIDKILEMSQIFMFLGGLCPEIMASLHEHLRQTVSEDSMAQKYRASCELDPWVVSFEGETLLHVQETMVECLIECWMNGHKHVTCLPVSDFFILSSGGWSDELKSLTVHNSVCSLFVNGDDIKPEQINDILNSVTVINSIQKLWFSKVSDIFLVQLVSQHKHSLSLRPEIWRHLECVSIQLVTMSGDTLRSLVDSILQLPKYVQVTLNYCSNNKETSDWKAYIQSQPRLTVVHDDDNDDEGDEKSIQLSLCYRSNRQRFRDCVASIQSYPCFTLDVDDDMMWNCSLLQFQTNKV